MKLPGIVMETQGLGCNLCPAGWCFRHTYLNLCSEQSNRHLFPCGSLECMRMAFFSRKYLHQVEKGQVANQKGKRVRVKNIVWKYWLEVGQEDVKTIPAERKPNNHIPMQKQCHCLSQWIRYMPIFSVWESSSTHGSFHENWKDEREGKPTLILKIQSYAQALGTRVEGGSGWRSRITSMLPLSSTQVSAL